MIIRFFDISVSILVLLASFPFFILIAVLIKLSSRGPIIYQADRIGLCGKRFRMFKFRSMHDTAGGAVITAKNDRRVFAVGRVIRALKLDELPQFLNVVLGDMSIVGPRPEAPEIVSAHYGAWMLDTLQVRPGITSPGAIFYYSYGDYILDCEAPDEAYVLKLLQPKLALDLAYSKRANALSNIVVIIHTAVAIFGKAVGKPVGPQLVDVKASLKWYPQGLHIDR